MQALQLTLSPSGTATIDNDSDDFDGGETALSGETPGRALDEISEMSASRSPSISKDTKVLSSAFCNWGGGGGEGGGQHHVASFDL